ncbi:phage protease, partial [Streptomyces caniscabiei]|uniref:phage protease n=1 Tax=Streptomyces caniscabiei TaxID=2746961 RepID=UPI0038F6F744
YEVALNRATTAEAELAEINQQKVEALVQSAIDDGKVAPADKDMYVGLCSSEKGREQFAKFIEGAPQIATNAKIKTPENPQGGDLTKEQLAL